MLQVFCFTVLYNEKKFLENGVYFHQKKYIHLHEYTGCKQFLDGVFTFFKKRSFILV